jgi:hypothetical protein
MAYVIHGVRSVGSSSLSGIIFPAEMPALARVQWQLARAKPALQCADMAEKYGPLIAYDEGGGHLPAPQSKETQEPHPLPRRNTEWLIK